MSEFEARAQQWIRPVSEDAPAGVNARYDDAYEQVDGEMQKLQSMEGKQPDWPLVVRLAGELLANRSKDTTMLGALCVGLLHTERYAGLAAGLLAYKKLVDTLWDQMFPPARRLRGRAGDYTWMVGQFADLVPHLLPESAELEALKTCNATFLALDDALRKRFGGLHPAVGALKRTLAGFTEQLEATVAPAAQAPTPTPAKGSAGAWAGDKTPTDPVVLPGVMAPVEAATSGTLLPETILNEQHADVVVEKATAALKMAAEFYQKRAKDLEEEKKRLEERLKHARKIVKLEKNVTDMMNRSDEEEDEEEGGT